MKRWSASASVWTRRPISALAAGHKADRHDGSGWRRTSIFPRYGRDCCMRALSARKQAQTPEACSADCGWLPGGGTLESAHAVTDAEGGWIISSSKPSEISPISSPSCQPAAVGMPIAGKQPAVESLQRTCIRSRAVSRWPENPHHRRSTASRCLKSSYEGPCPSQRYCASDGLSMIWVLVGLRTNSLGGDGRGCVAARVLQWTGATDCRYQSFSCHAGFCRRNCRDKVAQGRARDRQPTALPSRTAAASPRSTRSNWRLFLKKPSQLYGALHAVA